MLSMPQVLIPTLATPLTNLGALEAYISICDQVGDSDNAQRVRSYIVAHTIFCEQEADGDEIMGMPTD